MPVTLTISSLSTLNKLCALAKEDTSLRIEKDGVLVTVAYLHYGDRITIESSDDSTDSFLKTM